MRGRRASGGIIGEYEFTGCGELAGAVIPEDVTVIGRGAFSYCSALSCVAIGGNVKRIGSGAFFNSGLTDIYFHGTKEQWRAVEKGGDWDKGAGSFTVHCTDGDINN